VRLATNTSASSIRSTAFQLFAILNFRIRFSSTSSGLVPISVVVRTMRGLSRKFAMHSSGSLAGVAAMGNEIELTGSEGLSHARSTMQQKYQAIALFVDVIGGLGFLDDLLTSLVQRCETSRERLHRFQACLVHNKALDHLPFEPWSR